MDSFKKNARVEALIFDAWNSLPDCYSEVKKLAFEVLTIFGSTYSCEQAFSCMNIIKIIDELRKNNRTPHIILHHDEASSHTAKQTNKFLKEKNLELMSNPAYRPDLASCDSFLFPKIKNQLRGQRFSSPEEAVEEYEKHVSAVTGRGINVFKIPLFV
ncbi:Mariner Mos1 transposase [Eumeta japonica]|uniref:Mariner Mos1 transposase n=1 Tax=Eumeta variegata TaxID=151549 RepID=A0A4C1V5Z5_EUMVA|nr:Mariner Mos1 transposase [Eumeta japonica]